MLRTTLKSLLARKLRLVMSALAVVLGVSFVSGTLILTDTLNRTFDTLFAGINEHVSVAVRSVNAVDSASNVERPAVPATLVPVLSQVPGVVKAVGTVQGVAVLVDPRTGKAVDTGSAPGIGTSWSGGEPTSAEQIVEGRPPGDGEIVVDRATAKDNDLRIGDQLPVLTATPGTFTLVGTFTVAGKDSVGGATVTAFDTVTAQRLLLRPEQFSQINIAAVDGVSQTELRDAVARVIPAGTEAVTGKQLTEEDASVVQDIVGNFSTFLLIFAAIAVFVGAFIIFNTFTMLVAQRVRELALLRAVGASRRQVVFSVQVEAFVVGFVGATLGLVLGVGLAVLLRAATAAFGVTLPDGPLTILPRTIGVAYAVGVVVTGVAAYFPARKAAKVPPVAAMRETYVLPTRSLRMRAVAGVALTGVGALLMAVGLTSSANQATAVGGGAGTIFLGITTLSPLLSTPVMRVLGQPLTGLFGATGKIGRENAIRNPRRTASTASALMIGLALVSAFSVLGESIKVSVQETVSNSLGADFYLAPPGLGQSQGFSGEIARSLVGKPGIEVVTGLRGGQAKIGDASAQLGAVEPSAVKTLLALDGVAGDVGALGDGAIVMDKDVAASHGYTVGQRIPVTFSDGPSELTLVGIYKPSPIAGSYLVSIGEWSRHASSDSDMFVMVKISPGADPLAVRAEIDAAITAFPNVEVRDQTEFVAKQEEQVDQLLGFVYVLLALAVIIALFGIVNTLALSVIERTREIGLLRAVGMTRGQLRTMIRLEAMIIAVFGALLGVVVGSFFGWALTQTLEKQGVTTFAYPLVRILVVVVVGAVLGVLAAIFPARRAGRMDVLRAIATT